MPMRQNKLISSGATIPNIIRRLESIEAAANSANSLMLDDFDNAETISDLTQIAILYADGWKEVDGQYEYDINVLGVTEESNVEILFNETPSTTSEQIEAFVHFVGCRAGQDKITIFSDVLPEASYPIKVRVNGVHHLMDDTLNQLLLKYDELSKK